MYGKVLLVLIDIFQVFYKVIISFIDGKKKKKNPTFPETLALPYIAAPKAIFRCDDL